MDIDDVLLVAKLTARYIKMDLSLGCCHPEDRKLAEKILKLTQHEIIEHFGDVKGEKIIDEIRHWGNVQRNYGNYKRTYTIPSNKKSPKEDKENYNQNKKPTQKTSD